MIQHHFLRYDMSGRRVCAYVEFPCYLINLVAGERQQEKHAVATQLQSSLLAFRQHGRLLRLSPSDGLVMFPVRLGEAYYLGAFAEKVARV